MRPGIQKDGQGKHYEQKFNSKILRVLSEIIVKWDMENKIVVRLNIRFNRFIANLHNQVAEMTLFLKIFLRIVSNSKYGGEE